MSVEQVWALMPYLVLSGGIVVLLLAVAWLQSRLVAFIGSIIVIAVPVGFLPAALQGGTQIIDTVLEVDGYALFFFALFSLAAIATAVLSDRFLGSRATHRQEFYLLLSTATLGAAVAAGASHFATFLLGIEVLSISLYAMIAYPEEGHAPLEAAAKYLVLSGAASSTMLFGMALIYLASGSMSFDGAANVAIGEQGILTLGQGMLLAGIFFKLSLVPFHMWTPDVYQGAPAPVTGFVATVSKGAMFAVLLRYAVDADLLASPTVGMMVAVFAVVSMVAGNVLALLQTSLKRLLAYSSIAHLGYLMIALVVAGTPDGRALGVETGLVYVVGYVLMTLVAFGVVTVLSGEDEEADDLSRYEGLLWRRPILGAMLAAAARSLAGIPLTVGFIAKFYLVAAGVGNAAWGLVWALIVGSAIGIYYYLRIVFAMTKRPDGEAADEGRRLPWEGAATVVVLGLTVVALGVYPAPLIEFVRGLGGP
ncbi:MAG: NADH-quinone oxidoreductase subunit N [Gammaproteobacteria bacterium]|nr:NADH-quinone oxidoreductase subunit N [Gammaproteobacteria bacterium]